MSDISYTIYGAFTPVPIHFIGEDKLDEALQCARDCVNDWAPDVILVKSEVIWRAGDDATGISAE